VAETTEDGKRKLLGVTRLSIEPDGRRGEMAFIVGDKWQNYGLGTKMVDYVLEIAKEMGLEVNFEGKSKVNKLDEVNRQIKEILAENNVSIWMNYGDCGADFVISDKKTNEELYIDYSEWGK
jgi:GNAT superfamily N-acetyltransferase